MFVLEIVKQSPKVHAAQTDSVQSIITEKRQGIPPNGDLFRRVYYINLLYVEERGAAGDAEARESPSENAKKEKSGLTIDFCVKISVKAC